MAKTTRNCGHFPSNWVGLRRNNTYLYVYCITLSLDSQFRTKVQIPAPLGTFQLAYPCSDFSHFWGNNSYEFC